MTKYLLTIDYNGGTIETPMDEWSRADIKAHMDYYRALDAELTGTGELLQNTALTGPETGEDRNLGRHRPGRDRRPVRRVQGDARGLPDGRRRDRGARHRDRGADLGVPGPDGIPIRAADEVRRDDERRGLETRRPRAAVTTASGDRGPAARRWRRRSSACWSRAATATSTLPKTPSRRRCWPRRCTGRRTATPDNPRGVADPDRVPQAGPTRSATSRPGGGGKIVAGATRTGRAGRAVHDRDDTLTVLFMCCHPALTPASAIALTLRAVGGLTTAEIANAFLVPEATMAQRISRAKQRIKASDVPFRMPAGDRVGGAAALGAARALSDLQRGVRQQHRRRPATGSSCPARRSG